MELLHELSGDLFINSTRLNGIVSRRNTITHLSKQS